MPGCDGVGMAERSYPTSEARGGAREEPPCVQGQGWCPRPGAMARRSNPIPEARAVTGRSNPMSKEWGLPGCRRT